MRFEEEDMLAEAMTKAYYSLLLEGMLEKSIQEGLEECGKGENRMLKAMILDNAFQYLLSRPFRAKIKEICLKNLSQIELTPRQFIVLNTFLIMVRENIDKNVRKGRILVENFKKNSLIMDLAQETANNYKRKVVQKHGRNANLKEMHRK